MSTDNPFAAPAALQETGTDANFVKVAGDVLLCGREADLSAVCWVTGQPTSAEDRKQSRRFRLAYWPVPVRQFAWLVPMLLLVSSRMLAGDRHLMTLAVICSLWLGLPVVSRFRPTTYLTIAFSQPGRTLRIKQILLRVLLGVLAAAVTLLALKYADLADAILPRDLTVIKYLLMPLGGVAILMWGWNLVFPTTLKSKTLVIKDFSGGVFSVHGAPAEFLEGMERRMKQSHGADPGDSDRPADRSN